MKLTYPVIFYPSSDGVYVVDIPDLKTTTQGEGLANAIYMAVDAAAGWLVISMEDGEKLPIPSKIEDVVIDPEYEDVQFGKAFTSIILIDLEEKEKEWGNKPVKKTLTIPSWANEAGLKNNINFSQTLTEAIVNKLNNKN